MESSGRLTATEPDMSGTARPMPEEDREDKFPAKAGYLIVKLNLLFEFVQGIIGDKHDNALNFELKNRNCA